MQGDLLQGIAIIFAIVLLYLATLLMDRPPKESTPKVYTCPACGADYWEYAGKNACPLCDLRAQGVWPIR